MESRFCSAALGGMDDAFEEMLSSLSTLYSLGQVDVQNIDEKTLLRQALGALVEHAGIECCSIFFCRGDDLVNAAGLDWRDWHGELSPAPERPSHGLKSYPLLQSFMGLAVQTGEVRVCADCRNDARFKTSASGIAPGSLLSAPIRSCGNVIGVLNLSHPDPGHFGEWHTRLLSVFCDFLGQIITSSRLLKRMEEEVEIRTRQLEEALSETRLLKGHYQSLALTDPLTGLSNRRHFFSECRLALSRAVRYRRSFSLLMIDLDRFKQINDRHGHLQGDLVLKDVARNLQGQSRDTDILGRVGGEEFALALPESNRGGAADAAMRLQKSVRHLRWNCEGEEVCATISVGVVHLGAEVDLGERAEVNIDALLDRLYSQADKCMYEAKRQGGDRIVEASFS